MYPRCIAHVVNGIINFIITDEYTLHAQINCNDLQKQLADVIDNLTFSVNDSLKTVWTFFLNNQFTDPY